METFTRAQKYLPTYSLFSHSAKCLELKASTNKSSRSRNRKRKLTLLEKRLQNVLNGSLPTT